MTCPLTPGGETSPPRHLLSSALVAPCISQWCPLSGLGVTDAPMEESLACSWHVWKKCPLGHWVLASDAYW